VTWIAKHPGLTGARHKLAMDVAPTGVGLCGGLWSPPTGRRSIPLANLARMLGNPGARATTSFDFLQCGWCWLDCRVTTEHSQIISNEHPIRSRFSVYVNRALRLLSISLGTTLNGTAIET
jgi:hypothetical protein